MTLNRQVCSPYKQGAIGNDGLFLPQRRFFKKRNEIARL
jgi:hypothetical protein